jgi:hypothetical protein
MYQSVSFSSDARKYVDDPLSDYVIELSNPLKRVKQIQLAECDVPRTQYIVEEGMSVDKTPLTMNTLSFTEGFRLAGNAIAHDGTELFLPNHSNKALRIASHNLEGSEDYEPGNEVHYFATNVKWSVQKYNAWGKGEPLLLIGHGYPKVMDIAEFNTADLSTFNQDERDNYDLCVEEGLHVYTVQNVGTLAIEIGDDNITQYYTRYYFHRSPWHIPEMIAFANHAFGKTVFELTEQGEFRITGTISYPDNAEAVFNTMEGHTTGTFSVETLPFKVEGDRTTSNAKAPKMRATLPIGDYSPADVQRLLPIYMNLGLISTPVDENFPNPNGFLLKTETAMFTVTIALGHYPTPFLLEQAIQAALIAAGTTTIIHYAGETQKRVFEETQLPLKQYVFADTRPFSLDFRGSSEELIAAVGADRVVYGPSAQISLRNLVWPNFLGDQFASNIYTVGGTLPETHRFVLKSNTSPGVMFPSMATSYTPSDSAVGREWQRVGEIWLSDFNTVLPCQVNDMVNVTINFDPSRPPFQSSGKVFAYGKHYGITADNPTLADGQQLFQAGSRYLVKQILDDGDLVEGIVREVTFMEDEDGHETVVLDVFSMHNTNNNEFMADFGPIDLYLVTPNGYSGMFNEDYTTRTTIAKEGTFVPTSIMTDNKLGMLLYVGDDTPALPKQVLGIPDGTQVRQTDDRRVLQKASLTAQITTRPTQITANAGFDVTVFPPPPGTLDTVVNIVSETNSIISVAVKHQGTNRYAAGDTLVVPQEDMPGANSDLVITLVAENLGDYSGLATVNAGRFENVVGSFGSGVFETYVNGEWVADASHADENGILGDKNCLVSLSFIDQPKFEVEPMRNSVSNRLGVGDYRLSGERVYTFPFRWNLDPTPYYLLQILQTRGGVNPNKHLVLDETYSIHEEPFIAKLVINSQFTVSRNEVMEVQFARSQTVGTLEIRFLNPDGTLVSFHGRPHSLTLGFIQEM